MSYRKTLPTSEVSNSNARRSKTLRDHRIIAVVCCGVIAAIIWSAIVSSAGPTTAWLYMAFAVVAVIVNRSVLRTGYFSWINIYLLVSVASVAGYAALVEAHVFGAESWMPYLGSQSSRMAMAIIGLALIAIETGALCSYFVPIAGSGSQRDAVEIGRMLRRTGLIIAALSAVLIAALLLELGGSGALTGGHYVQYMNLLYGTSPVMGTVGVTYFPLGLITYYIGACMSMDKRTHSFRRRRRAVYACFLGFAALFLLIGDRNSPLIATVAVLYARHHFDRPVRIRWMLVLLVCGFIAVGIVGQVRNASSNATTGNGNGPVHAAIDPITDTFRPYEQFVQLFAPTTGSQRALGLLPYESALKEVIPFYNRGILRSGTRGFVRSSVYITQLVDPAEAAINLYEGGSNIGEAYAAFGRWGVFLTEFILGFGIAVVERRALLRRGLLAIVLLVINFSDSLFYIRGDVFGEFRDIAWALMLGLGLLAVQMTARRHRGGIAQTFNPSSDRVFRSRAQTSDYPDLHNENCVPWNHLGATNASFADLPLAERA